MLLKTGNLSTHELYFISRKYAGMSGIKLLKEKNSQKVYRENTAVFTGLSLPDSQVRLL